MCSGFRACASRDSVHERLMRIPRFAACLLPFLAACSSRAPQRVDLPAGWAFEHPDAPAIGQHAMVATEHPLASQVGADVLRRGGNAIDAVVAVSFAQQVVSPRAGNIGGGGFLVYRTADGQAYALDYREKAP